MKDTLLSPVVIAATIAAITAYRTARVPLADLRLKRRLETAQRFTDLAEVANNANGSRGAFEMIAALELIASFGRDEPHLREAARAVLMQAKVDLYEGTSLNPFEHDAVVGAATTALDRLPDEGDAQGFLERAAAWLRIKSSK